MKIEPYLFFHGRCEEALAFYQTVFDAEVTLLLRHRDSPEPPPMPLPAGWEEKVMHASLQIGETSLMASDGCGGEGTGFQGFSLAVALPDTETATRIFAALAAEGEVQMPLGKTFFSPCFGMVTDRFGIHWMLNVTP